MKHVGKDDSPFASLSVHERSIEERADAPLIRNEACLTWR